MKITSSRLELKQLELSDRHVFEKAYSSIKKPLADQDFSMLCIWNRILNMRWALVNGNLCIFADFDGKTVLWGPVIGGSKLKETLDVCFSYIDSLEKNSPVLCYLPEELAHAYSDLDGYKAVHQNQDYVYKTEDISLLQGGQYKNKRNLVNNFLSNFSPQVEFYDSSKHLKGCLELLEQWKEQKLNSGSINKIRFQFMTELKVARETIRMAETLKLRGLVVIVEGRIQGMTFGSDMGRGTCNVIVEKTNHNIKGISEFIFSEFIRRCWQGFSLVNAQEDMGVEYLKAAKMSYHPFFLIRSFSVIRDGTA